MSAERPNREVAYRIFAAEYDDCSVTYTESDEERAPNYVISPTGGRINRLFAVGTLTEVSQVNDEMIRARIVDPTGAFVVYAGQYQPDALAFFERIEPPSFVAVTGKARTFEPEDGDRVYTSIRPESVATVDVDTRDRWVVSTAERTLDRLGTYAAAARFVARTATDEHDGTGQLIDALVAADVDESYAQGITLAMDHYGTTPAYLDALRAVTTDALETVTGERDSVRALDCRPAETIADSAGFDELARLTDVELQVPERTEEPTGEIPAAGFDSESVGDDGLELRNDEPDQVTAAAEAADSDVTVPPKRTTDTAIPSAVETDSRVGSVGDSDDETTGGDEKRDTVTESGGDVSKTTETKARPVDSEQDSDDDGIDDSDSDEIVPASGSDSVTDETDETDVTDVTDDIDVEDIGTDDDIELGDELGDFDAESDGEPGMYEMDDEERREIEAEYGAEFTTGDEVEGPDESTDVEAAGSQTAADRQEDIEAPETSEDESSPVESADESDTTDDESATAEGVDLQDVVVETMAELDDGEGADRGTLVETVVSETDSTDDAVEDAIQDALMSGQCYEPDDETLKAI